MTAAVAERPTPLRLRQRWRELRPRSAAPRVALLASYTIDPLVPYLGVYLHEAGIPAAITVGPFNQIAQQCLDDAGEVARTEPHILVVAPRLEELGEDATAELLGLADVALSAAQRRQSCLVFVLPALPDPAAWGVGDLGTAQGGWAAAVAARAAVRARLAGRPNVHLADAEAAVRAVGSSDAYRPAMFRYAKVPYAEEVFAELGRQLAAVIGLRYGMLCRAVVLHADSLLVGPAGEAREELDALREPLRALSAAQVPIMVCGSAESGAGPAALTESDPALLTDLVLDQRPLAEQLDDLVCDWALPPGQVVVLTAADSAELADAGVRVLRLGDEPDQWPGELARGGVLDRLPVAGPAVDQSPIPSPTADTGMDRASTLAAYVASLDVRIDWRVAGTESVERIADMVLRTKDFTTGLEAGEPDIEARVTGAGTEIHLAEVRDRLGDYGTGVALGLEHRSGVCVVDLFLVSCPVLGRGVEEAALRHILDFAGQHDCATIEFRYRDTGRNDLLAEFTEHAATDQPALIRTRKLDT